MNKKLEPGSEYNKYDADGDGVVTDAGSLPQKGYKHLRLLMKKLTLKEHVLVCFVWHVAVPSGIVITSF